MDDGFDAYLQGFGVGLVFAGLFNLWLGAIASFATVIIGSLVIIGGYYFRYFG